MTHPAFGRIALLILLVASGTLSAQIPDDLTAAARKAEQIGRLLYDNDAASAMATDEMFRQGVPQRDRRVRGWITSAIADGWKVTFVGDADGRIAALYEVAVPRARSSELRFVAYDPPREMSEPENAMYAARTTALREGQSGCSNRYNSVVLEDPASHPSSWTVYVFAASTQVGEMIVGGHSKVSVTTDGRKALAIEQLAKSCLRLQQPTAQQGTVAAAFVTHLLSPAPSEIHVFLSLLHQKPILVGTSAGNWKVENGTVSFLGAR